MADEIGELGAQFSIDGGGDTTLDGAGDGEIRKRDALVNEEGASSKMGIKRIQGTDKAFEKVCVDLRKVKSGGRMIRQRKMGK